MQSGPRRLGLVLTQVSDMDAAIRFYRDVLGLRPRALSPSWSELELDGNVIALHPRGEAPPPTPAAVAWPSVGFVPCLEVGDIHAFRSHLETRGVRVAALHDIPNGLVFDFLDPDGNTLQAMQRGASRRPGAPPA